MMPTKTTNTKEVEERFSFLFNVFGVPRRIVSDRGTCFTYQAFERFTSKLSIKHVKVAVAFPWANGQVERVNRFILAKAVNDTEDWKDKLNNVQYVLNNTYHKAVDTTPSNLLLGYHQRKHSDSELCDFIDKLTEVDKDLFEKRIVVRDCAKIANQTLQEYNKSYYDKKYKKPSMYKVGDLVMIRSLTAKPGLNQKLLPKYKGLYEIKAVLRKNRYVVTDKEGYNWTQKPYNAILSADKLKPWIRVEDNIDSVETENHDNENDRDI